jgi:D-alanine-D-alanine ligase
MGVPYIGSKFLASAVAMDKVFSKQLMLMNGIPTPEFEVLKRGQKPSMSVPYVVKPSDGGSTIGVSIVKENSAIAKALKEGFKHADTLIIERYIDGREITVPVFEEKALEIIEIRPKTSFYDYKAKYVKGMSEHILPARLPKKLYAEAQELAEKVHAVLGLQDFSRIDFMLDMRGKLFVLEANTLPGLTGTSLLPEAMKYAGVSFSGMVAKMLFLAIKNG